MIGRVYALHRNFKIYIGLTTVEIESRFSGHVRDIYAGGRSRRTCWLRSLKDRNLLHEVERLELENVLDTGDLSRDLLTLGELERKWIAYFKSLPQYVVLNHNDGGQGLPILAS